MSLRHLILTTGLLLGLAGAATAATSPTPPAPARPLYPLYSPFFGGRHEFTPEDLRAIAENFDFVYGQALTAAEMTVARQIAPDLKFLRYVGNWAVGGRDTERDLRSRILYYEAARLGADLDAAATEFVLAPAAGRALLFKPSTTPDDYSVDGESYVTWLRVGDEFMRIDGWDQATRRVQVRRGFAGTAAAVHAAHAPVLHPAYSSVPGRGRISYLYDPAYPDRWTSVLRSLTDFTGAGGDGIWIDILMASTLGDSDVGGTRLRGVNAESEAGDLFVWDFAHQRAYTRDAFRRRTERQVRMIQEQFRARTGRAPLIYGNNMYYTEYTAAGGATWHYLVPTPEKPEPVAGMCIEDYMGGYDATLWSNYSRRGEVVPPPKASFGPHTYRNWCLNQGMLAECAQRGLPAVPLILNAGMKTAIFEKLDRATRHDWERWAYASYLLCVEVRDGRCVTKLGVPMFYFDAGKRHVDIDPMYRWPIGTPAETKPAARFDDYKLAGTGVYARRFTGGTVLVNPGAVAESVALPEPLWHPDTGEKTSRLTLPPQTGLVLLQAPLPGR